MKLITVLIFATSLAWAQNFSYDPNDPILQNLKQEGQLVSVQIVLGEPLRIFVVGREEAKLDFSELKLTVRRIKPYPAKTLKITKNGDYFAVNDSLSLDNTNDLEVRTTVKNKEEVFRFKIEKKLP